MSKTEKTKEVNQKNIEGKPTPEDITPILLVLFGVFGIIGIISAFIHPNIGYSIIVMNFYGYGSILFAVSMLFWYSSDMWFVGPKFDPIYKEKILKIIDQESKFKKIPYWAGIASFRPSRTAAYSWRLINKKFEEKKVFEDDNLKDIASFMDIVMAWLTLGTLLISFLNILIGAVLG